MKSFNTKRFSTETLPKHNPGMGPWMGPRMLAALGDNRDRFNSAEEIQNYAGIAPVTERSSQKSWVHWRWQCARFVSQTFVEWAARTVNSSYWPDFITRASEKKKSHQSAIRTLHILARREHPFLATFKVVVVFLYCLTFSFRV